MLRSAAGQKKRQLLAGLALFLCLLSAACSQDVGGDVGRQAPASCRQEAVTALERVAVDYVYDGDTLRLRGGERLRLVGINTPELGRDGSSDEPLARAAQGALESLVAGGHIWLEQARDSRDRHGRRLAYAFDGQGNSVSAVLLQQGLGFHVAISPNTAYADCLQLAERRAREEKRGVWAVRAFEARSVASLRPSEGGFRRIRGEVTHVSFKDNGWWVQLGGKVGLRIKAADQAQFSRRDLAALEGETVEARGWLVARDGDWWLMNIGHPSMMQPVLDP